MQGCVTLILMGTREVFFCFLIFMFGNLLLRAWLKIFFKILCLCNLYTQPRAQTHNPESRQRTEPASSQAPLDFFFSPPNWSKHAMCAQRGNRAHVLRFCGVIWTWVNVKAREQGPQMLTVDNFFVSIHLTDDVLKVLFYGKRPSMFGMQQTTR